MSARPPSRIEIKQQKYTKWGMIPSPPDSRVIKQKTVLNPIDGKKTERLKRRAERGGSWSTLMGVWCGGGNHFDIKMRRLAHFGEDLWPSMGFYARQWKNV